MIHVNTKCDTQNCDEYISVSIYSIQTGLDFLPYVFVKLCWSPVEGTVVGHHEQVTHLGEEGLPGLHGPGVSLKRVHK